MDPESEIPVNRAFAVQVPVFNPAVMVGDVAMPFESVTLTAVVDPPANVPSPDTKLKVTCVFTIGLPYWSVASATMGWENGISIVADWS